MRKTLLAAACASALSAWAHDDWSLNNHWNVTGDFIYFKRNSLNGKNLVNDSAKIIDLNDPNPNFSVLSTKRLVNQFTMEPGYRIIGSYTPNKHCTVEALFMTCDHWSGKKTVTGEGTLSFPFNDPNYGNDWRQGDKAKAEYRSQFYNGELNYWYHFTPRRADYFSVSGLVGPRYIQVDEKFDLAFTKGFDVSTYEIHTWNHIYALQVGLNFQVNPTRWLTWEFTGKIGGAANRSKQRTFLGDDNNTVTLRRFQNSRVNAVFIGDALGMVTLQATSNVSFHGAYEILYVTSIACAPSQVNKGTSSHSGKHVETTDHIFLHGILAGINLGF